MIYVTFLYKLGRRMKKIAEECEPSCTSLSDLEKCFIDDIGFSLKTMKNRSKLLTLMGIVVSSIHETISNKPTL